MKELITLAVISVHECCIFMPGQKPMRVLWKNVLWIIKFSLFILGFFILDFIMKLSLITLISFYSKIGPKNIAFEI